jgi:hypothetical protein
MIAMNPELYEINPETGRPYLEDVSPSGLSGLLIQKEEAPEGTYYSPGRLPRTLWEAWKRFFTWPAQLDLAAQKIAERAARNLDITKEGLLVRKSQAKAAAPEPSEGRWAEQWRQRRTAPAPQATEAPTVPMYSAPPTTEPQAPAYVPVEEQPGTTLTTPEPTAAPTAEPTSAAPAPIPDFSAIFKTWGQTPIDVEKESQRIMEEEWPKEMPKPQIKEPTTPKEWFTDLARNMALALSGKDPLAYRLMKEGEAKEEAKREGELLLRRAGQIINIRLNALSTKMQQQEQERARRAQYLQWIQAQYPEITREPYFQTAVASLAGIPKEQAEEFIKQHIDPKTGLLQDFYKSPMERAAEEEKAKINAKINIVAETTGLSREDAAMVALTGQFSPETLYAMKLARAVASRDPKKIAEAQADLQRWRQLTQTPTDQQVALEMVTKYNQDPTFRKNIHAIFGDSTDRFMRDTTAQALGIKGYKEPEPKDINVDERVAREAYAALHDPSKSKAFRDRYGMTPDIVVKYRLKGTEGIVTEGLGYPEKAARIVFKGHKGPLGDLMQDPYSKKAIDNYVITTFAPIWNDINKDLPKNKGLTIDEMYELATYIDQGNADLFWARRKKVYEDRGLKMPVPTK